MEKAKWFHFPLEQMDTAHPGQDVPLLVGDSHSAQLHHQSTLCFCSRAPGLQHALISRPKSQVIFQGLTQSYLSNELPSCPGPVLKTKVVQI